MTPEILLLLNMALSFHLMGPIWAVEVDFFRSWKLVDRKDFPTVKQCIGASSILGQMAGEFEQGRATSTEPVPGQDLGDALDTEAPHQRIRTDSFNLGHTNIDMNRFSRTLLHSFRLFHAGRVAHPV